MCNGSLDSASLHPQSNKSTPGKWCKATKAEYLAQPGGLSSDDKGHEAELWSACENLAEVCNKVFILIFS